MSLYDALVIKEEKIKIDKKLWICSDCLKLLTLSGALKDFFIVTITVTDAKCEICGKNYAEFFVGPKKLGIYICNSCLSEKGGQVWKKYRTTKKGLCDLCRKNEGYLYNIP
mgnify:CR=1 FL=1